MERTEGGKRWRGMRGNEVGGEGWGRKRLREDY